MLILWIQTASAITFVIMAAATHPEEQKKVQAEIDEVIGRDRGVSPDHCPNREI